MASITTKYLRVENTITRVDRAQDKISMDQTEKGDCQKHARDNELGHGNIFLQQACRSTLLSNVSDKLQGSTFYTSDTHRFLSVVLAPIDTTKIAE